MILLKHESRNIFNWYLIYLKLDTNKLLLYFRYDSPHQFRSICCNYVYAIYKQSNVKCDPRFRLLVHYICRFSRVGYYCDNFRMCTQKPDSALSFPWTYYQQPTTCTYLCKSNIQPTTSSGSHLYHHTYDERRPKTTTTTEAEEEAEVGLVVVDDITVDVYSPKAHYYQTPWCMCSWKW